MCEGVATCIRNFGEAERVAMRGEKERTVAYRVPLSDAPPLPSALGSFWNGGLERARC